VDVAVRTYNVKEIAEMLNTNQETVRRWIRSGKLDAIQKSRKGGNVVTEVMLDAFLKSSPKYAASLLSTPIGITAATTAFIVGLVTNQLIKSDSDRDVKVEMEEIRKLLLSNISVSEDNIKRKRASIRQLEEEISIEERNIEEAQRVITKLETQLKSDASEDGGT
jgi:excisionase family DNA binding protein